MKNAYKSIIAIVLVSLFVSLLSVSVAMPASAQENFIVIIDQDKIFTTSNFHNSEIKVAPNHPRQGRPSVIDAISDSQEAASHILSERYQEGYAKGWVGGDGYADSQCYVLVRDIKIEFVQPPVGSISVSTNIESATFTISGHATYSGRGTSWSKGDGPVGTYTITYGAVSGYRTPPSETKTLITGESITFSGDYLLKKGAGDSIDCGDGYILLIRNVDPKGGEVLMELQLDDRSIDDKILRKGESYILEKYNKVTIIYIDVVDIYHNTTGDYVVLWPMSANMTVPHLDLIIASVPQRVDIQIDGEYVGKTPKTVSITDLEMHSLRLELSGYEDWEGTFKFEQGEGKKEMPITLSKIEPTPIITLSEGTIEVYTYPPWSPEKSFAAIESATFTISGPATYSGSGYWIQSNALPGTYTITYGSVSGYKSPPSETKTLSAGGSITFEEHYLLKKRAGDSFDFGDGYVLFIRKVDPERGEVSIELQLDNRTIDDKILRKNEEYYVPFKKYSQVELAINFNVEDIYHDTTGDYIDLWFPPPVAPAVPHSNLIIASVPQGADILIDGEYVGKTPKTITIADLEMHSLCLELSGYEDVERTFDFESYFWEEEMLIPLNQIQPTPTITPSEVKTPSAPRDLLATPGDGYVNLEWDAPSDDGGSPITNYNIYRDTTSGGETLLAIVDNVITYSDTSVTNNQKYYYQVSAVNSAGEGARSNEVSVSAMMLVPHAYSPTPSTPTPTPIPTPIPTPVPYTPKPTRVPGFLAITFILAILCGYLILKKWNR